MTEFAQWVDGLIFEVGENLFLMAVGLCVVLLVADKIVEILWK